MQGKVSVRGRLQRSLLTDDYSRKMRERVEAVKPKRHIKLLTDASLSETGSNLKMLQSGAIQTNAGFNTAVSTRHYQHLHQTWCELETLMLILFVP